MEESIENKKEEPKKGIPKLAWLIGCGCLSLVAIVVIIAVAVFLVPRFFGGGDPIASIVPADTMLYANIDFLKMQSEEVNDLALMFQDIADLDEELSIIELMDDFFDDEFDLSFSENVLPWIGQYGAFAVLDGDFVDGDVDMLFIVETKSKKDADKFLIDLAEAMDDEQDMDFDTQEKNGVLIYTYESEWGDDTVMARGGNYVYFSNSEDAILDSVVSKKGDSLASTDAYTDAMAELSKTRLASVYMSGDAYSDFFDEMAYEVDVEGMVDGGDFGIGGAALGVAVEDVGLRFDVAVSYDKDRLSDYQKDVLAIKNIAPKTDDMVPSDTFLFMSSSTSEGPGIVLRDDSPFYTSDAEEALELFEDEFGFNLEEVLDLFKGEFSFAVAPSRDGMFSELGNVDLGITFIASVTDEEKFDDWFEDMLDSTTEEMGVSYDTDKTTIADYELLELVVDDGYDEYSLMYYGATKGYFIAGSSEDMLEDGLGKENSLADNTTYRNTWKAFPSGSFPYFYLDMLGLYEVLDDFASEIGSTQELHEADSVFEEFPVIAMTVNDSSNYTQAYTLILFLNADN